MLQQHSLTILHSNEMDSLIAVQVVKVYYGRMDSMKVYQDY